VTFVNLLLHVILVIVGWLAPWNFPAVPVIDLSDSTR